MSPDGKHICVVLLGIFLALGVLNWFPQPWAFYAFCLVLALTHTGSFSIGRSSP